MASFKQQHMSHFGFRSKDPTPIICKTFQTFDPVGLAHRGLAGVAENIDSAQIFSRLTAMGLGDPALVPSTIELRVDKT